MSDPVDLLERTLDQTARTMTAVRPDQARLSTPCASWDVGALVAHMIFGLDRYLEQARGSRPDWSAEAPDPGPDWTGAFRTKADELVGAWRAAGDLSGTLDLPGIGEVPATFPLDQQVTEYAVHTWDLARATGQDADLDPEIAEHARLGTAGDAAGVPRPRHGVRRGGAGTTGRAAVRPAGRVLRPSTDLTRPLVPPVERLLRCRYGQLLASVL